MRAESLPHWDLSNVYPGLESEQFKKAVAALKGQIAELETYCSRYRVGRHDSDVVMLESFHLKEIVDGYLTRMNSVLRLFSTINAFITSYVTTDSYNVLAKHSESELEVTGVQIKKIDVRFLRTLS
jgi:hypothetical protein